MQTIKLTSLFLLGAALPCHALQPMADEQLGGVEGAGIAWIFDKIRIDYESDASFKSTLDDNSAITVRELLIHKTGDPSTGFTLGDENNPAYFGKLKNATPYLGNSYTKKVLNFFLPESSDGISLYNDVYLKPSNSGFNNYGNSNLSASNTNTDHFWLSTEVDGLRFANARKNTWLDVWSEANLGLSFIGNIGFNIASAKLYSTDPNLTGPRPYAEFTGIEASIPLGWDHRTPFTLINRSVRPDGSSIDYSNDSTFMIKMQPLTSAIYQEAVSAICGTCTSTPANFGSLGPKGDIRIKEIKIGDALLSPDVSRLLLPGHSAAELPAWTADSNYVAEIKGLQIQAITVYMKDINTRLIDKAINGQMFDR